MNYQDKTKEELINVLQELQEENNSLKASYQRVITGRKQAEEELRKTSDYLENLINYANAPIIVWNPEFIITRFNHAFEHLSAYKADEVIGKKLDFLFPESSAKESLIEIEKTSSGEHWESVEIPILRKNGEVRIALWNSATLYAKDGKTIVSTIAQGQDITERKQAEEELRKTSDYLENLINYANAPIIVWNPEFIITRFNHAFEHLSAYKADEVIGKKLDFLFPESSTKESLIEIEKTSGGEHWESVEIPILRKDGEVRIALWNSATLYAKDGKTNASTIAQGQDITERKQAEEKLLKNEHNLNKAQRLAKIGSWELDILSNQLIWSDEVYRIFGLEQQQFENTYKLFQETIHPDDKDYLNKSYIDSVESKTPYNITYRLLLKDGTQKWVIEHCENFYDNADNPIRSIGTVQDITERKLMENKLKDSEIKYRNLFENSSEFLFTLDLKGNFTDVNKAAEVLTGYTKAELIKMNFKDYSPKSDIRKLFSTLSYVYKTGKPVYNFPVEAIIKDGSIKYFETSFSLLKKGERIIGFQGNSKDITERKMAEEKEKEHHKNIRLLSETAMQFVEYPQDKDIYTYIGQQLQELIGKDSYVIVNSIDTESNALITRAIIGMGKLSEKVANLIGKNPIGITYNVEDESLVYLFDGKLHLYKEGLYGISLKTTPKTVSKLIEKLLNIKSIFTIGLIKDNELFGTFAILVKENTGELKNKQLIETFVKQASIAVQKKQAEEALKESNENYQQVVSNITTVVWKADIGENGAFENTYTSPVTDELLELPAGTMKNDWDKYFGYIKPEYLEQVNNAFREAIISPGKKIDCEYEVLKDNGQTAWFHSTGRCFEKNGKLHVFGSTSDITKRKQAEDELYKRLNELETFNRVTVGRELMMIELKKEINELLVKYGKESKYKIAE